MKTFKELRKNLSSIRDELFVNAECNHSLATRLRVALAEIETGCIAVYWPIKSEFRAIDVAVEWANSPQKKLALPVVQINQPLRFGLLDENTPMHFGPQQIPEPILPSNAPGVIPDILIIPCLGWQSRNGQTWRIGYGAGYYDRTLEHLRKLGLSAKTWGISYKALEVNHEAWQPQAHDQPLDLVLTD